MANSTTNVDTVIASQASKEVTINAAFDAASQAMTYGRRASTSSGLTWGYYGGNVVKTDGTMAQIANGTLTLTASNTNYIVAAKATGAVTVSTANTNWLNQTDYWRLYSVVAGDATVTSYTDSRDFMQRPAVAGGMATVALGGTGQDFSAVEKGGIVSGTDSGEFGLTAVGTDGYFLAADAASAGGVKWVSAPGGGDMLLGTAQTVTASKSFNDGTLIVNGSTSGTTTIKAAAEAGTTTVTLPAATGTVALTSNKLSAFAETSSAELAGVISDETGTGALVFNNSPAFVDDITVGGAGVASGQIKLNGTTSGTVTLSVADEAGTYTLKLPTTDGTANQLLQTDGDGNTTWATVSAGGGDMLLGTAQTVTASKTFGDDLLILAGSTSGTTKLNAADVAGTTTITFPAVTDTAVTLAATQTLTNKTLTTPAIGGDATLSTGNLVIGTSGKGIDFSTNSSAAGMTSELLDGYEEGTWTPNQGAGLTVVGTFGSSGKYTKVGRVVVVIGYLTSTTSLECSASSVICSNLPFTPIDFGVGIYLNGGFNASSAIYISTNNAVYSTTAITTTNYIYFTATYFV